MQVVKNHNSEYPIGILWNMGNKYAREMMLKIAIMEDVLQVKILDLGKDYEQFVLDCYEGDEEAYDGGYIYEKIKNVFENIEQLNELEVLRLKDDVLNDKDEIFSILDYINTCFYNKMINNISKAEKYNNCIQAVEEAKTRLRRNSNYDMTIDNLLFAIERSITNG